MALADVPSSVVGLIRSWLLFEQEWKSLPPLESASPQIVSFQTHVLDPADRPTALAYIRDDALPNLNLTECAGDGWRIGSGWAVKNSGLVQSGDSDGRSDSVSVEATARSRFAVYESEGLGRLMVTVKVNPKLVGFYKVSEVDGRTNLSKIGAMDRFTGEDFSSSALFSYKSCPFCAKMDRVCDCATSLTYSYFEKEFKERQLMYRQSPSLVGASLGKYARSWMAGQWTFQENGVPKASSKIQYLYSWETLRPIVTCVLQSKIDEIMKPTFGLPSCEDGRQQIVLLQERSSSSIHSSRQLYPCPLCPAVLGRRVDRRRHIRGVHEKIREHTCHLCNRSFLQAGHLNDHIRTVHEDAMDFACSTCGKAFGIRSNLNRHIITVHADVRNYPCNVCAKSYKEKSSLQKHQRRYHNTSTGGA